MKKKILYPSIATLLAIVAALLFLNFGIKEETAPVTEKTTAEKWTLKKVDNFRIMTVSPEGNWLTDIMNATLLKRLEDGSLPISIDIAVEGTITPSPVTGMKCRLQYDGVEVNGSLRNFKSSAADSTVSCSGTAHFNYAKAKNASVENLYRLSALPTENLKLWVKPILKEAGNEEWHELECN